MSISETAHKNHEELWLNYQSKSAQTDPTKQYGSGGKLQGRKFMICATWNASAEAFDNSAQQLL